MRSYDLFCLGGVVVTWELAQWLRLILWIVVAVLAWLGVGVQAQIPEDAYRYRRDLIRNATMVWGLSAPVSTFAGQIHQESSWRPDVVSPVGARGLSQFMPATATWISGLQVALQSNEPENPQWAIRALVEYNLWLYDRVPNAANFCEQMAFVLSSYNGGMGNLQRDVALTRQKEYDPTRWFEHVEQFNGSRRSAANFAENRTYPKRILRDLERRYAKAGWGQQSCSD